MATKKGDYRLLTPGEISMVISVFQAAINVASVRVHNDTYLPFQNEDTAVTPNGELYWPEKHFKEDYSVTEIWRKHWFMHEMVHVWQYQMGMSVKIRGIVSFMVDYEYELENGKLLSDYGMEQQAGIIADYYLLSQHGYGAWLNSTKELNRNEPPVNNETPFDKWMGAYKKNLELFLKDPKDKKALFG